MLSGSTFFTNEEEARLGWVGMQEGDGALVLISAASDELKITHKTNL